MSRHSGSRKGTHRIPGRYFIIVAAVLGVLGFVRPGYAQGITLAFQYKLSDFSGTLPLDSVKIFADRSNHEIYVTGTDNTVRIFNETGMELYRINDDGSLGTVYDTVVDQRGDILILSYTYSHMKRKYSVIRCNYRGDRVADIEFKNFPPDFPATFFPSALEYQAGHLYLVDKNAMRVVVTDEAGVFEQNIDLISRMGLEENKRYDVDMSGFAVDKEGNILFTVPVLFKVFRLSTDGTLAAFGERGGSPGKFNIVAGIAVDDNGYYYISDQLKSAILIFDPGFHFLTQVGQRGGRDEDLIGPTDLTILDNKLYITQTARRGVSVFSIKRELPPQAESLKGERG